MTVVATPWGGAQNLGEHRLAVYPQGALGPSGADPSGRWMVFQWFRQRQIVTIAGVHPM
jgi:hypothetical protein